MKTIPILLCDYYKLVHHKFYDQRITRLVSYYTPRGSRLPMGDNQTVIMFGLQGFIKEYLIERFNNEFFSVPFMSIKRGMKRFLTNTFIYEEELMKKIEELHSLRYLPLEIRAIPEGSKACIKCPMIEMTTTDERFFWIGEFIESMISSYVWKPMIDANVAYWYRNIVNEYYEMTVDDFIPRDRAMSEFGFRGADSPESGIHSGAAWLTSFRSTATCSAIEYITQYYNEVLIDEEMTDLTYKIESIKSSIPCDIDDRVTKAAYIEANNARNKGVKVEEMYFKCNGKLYKFAAPILHHSTIEEAKSNIIEITDDIASGLRSTEHSIMCSSFSIDGDEITFVRRLLTELAPDRGISMVSDSYDYWSLVNSILPKMKIDILSRDGTLYVRGDSGDPIKIVSGYVVIGTELRNDQYVIKTTPEELKVPSRYCCAKVEDKYFKLMNIADIYDTNPCWVPNFNKELAIHEVKGTVECLYDIFGGYTNSKGYKVLDDHIRAIYGDSITHNRARLIYSILAKKGLAANNVSLGSGSFSFHAYEGGDGKLYPYTRDTYGAAIKACGGEYVDDNGVKHSINIFKDPKTCEAGDTPKRSLRGCCSVNVNEEGNYYLDHDGLSYDDARSDQKCGFITVFLNGVCKNQTSLTEVRNRLHGGRF